jgi:ABC-2 type transport system ATP-binding protein
MIEAEGLVKRYGSYEAVKGVSFRIERGQVVGLLGPNGAGKSSVMRILTSYHFPSAGTARVASHDVNRRPDLVRQAVGYLPESAPLYQDMRVSEYLSFIADARSLAGQLRRDRIAIVVEACGLAEVFTREIGRLSKGYRQRVGLAQAILHDPEVLVLDEPTSGLDPNQIMEIRALILSLGKEKTVLLSTHILQEVEALCPRILVMNDGRLIAQGSPDEIARGLREGVILSVALKGPIEEALAASLGSLPGVRSVSAVRKISDGRVEIDLDIDAGTDPSEAIYDWAVARGRKILGMKTETTRLEDIFALLIRGKRDA